MKPKASRRSFLLGSTILAALTATQSAHAVSGSWSGAGSAWLTPTNWTGSNLPGSPTVTTNVDIATFALAANATAGINFNTTAGVYYLGAVDYTQATARNIGNSSSAVPGVLTLNGTTVNSVANTILRNSTTTVLTIQAAQSGGGTMGLALGNTTNNIVQITNTGGITISSSISGGASNPLTLQGGGTGNLTLSGANTYTGVTNVNTGTLTITNATSLGTTAGNTVVASGARVFAGTLNLNTAEAFTIAGAGIAGANGAINIGGSATGVVFSGAITLSAVATIQGDGSTGTTFSGGIDTAGNAMSFNGSGTITVNTNGISGVGGSVIKNTGGVLNFNVANTYTGTTTVNAGTLNMNVADSFNGATTTINGGVLSLNAANSYAGVTTIGGGVLQLGDVNALQNTSGITIGGASAATLSSSLTGITISAPITTANTGITSTIAFGIGTAAVGNITLNGAIGGNGNVAFTSPNANSGGNLQTINLGAAGTYAGSTNLNTGNINVNLTLRNSSSAANVLPTSTVLTFGTGAGPVTASRTTTFDLNGQNQTLAGLGSLAAVAVPNGRNHRVSSTGAATLTINSTANQTFGGTTVAGSLTTSAQIAGAISLVKNGAGTFTLGGLLTGGATASGNTFTGSTTVLGGILVLGETRSIQNSAFDTGASIAGDATNGLRANVTTVIMGGLTGNKNFADVFTTTAGGYGTVTALTLNPGTGATPSYSGVIADGAGGMNLTKSGAGTQTLSGANTYTGATTISAGVLSAGNLVVSGGSSNLGNATSAVTLGTATTQGTLSYTGNSDTYTRGLTIGGAGGGRLEVTTSGQTLTVATADVTGSGLFTAGGAGNTSISANVTHTGGLTKADAGTVTLGGANTYSGATTVSGGTLDVNGSLSGTTGVTVNSGGTLLLSGASGEQVNDAATVGLGGGTLAFNHAANQIETLGALTLSVNSTLDFGLGGGNDSLLFAGVGAHTAGDYSHHQ